ncbi:MAG: SMP-30/gluconolactonase/LRE family protein [Salinibacter sp.]
MGRFLSISVIAPRILLVLGPLLIGVFLFGCGEGNSESSSPSAENLFESRTMVPPGSFTSGIEGPAVDAEGNLYAVDYKRNRTIGVVPPDGEASVFVDLPEGSRGNGIRFDSEGTMLVADYTGHNVLAIDPSTREVRVYAHESRMNQPNDLAIGANDRLYASDPNWSESTGQIWRVDRDGDTTLLEAGMGTTNGIEVGPDNETLYVNESVQRNVWAYDLSENGSISDKRLFIEFSSHGLDGMRADMDGNLYITRHGKGSVVKVSPDGKVLREIDLAGKNPTNIAFGGEEGRQAYVTVADRGTIETFRVDRPGRSWRLRRERRK